MLFKRNYKIYEDKLLDKQKTFEFYFNFSTSTWPNLKCKSLSPTESPKAGISPSPSPGPSTCSIPIPSPKSICPCIVYVLDDVLVQTRVIPLICIHNSYYDEGKYKPNFISN